MGVGVSNWRLAQAVARLGQLGIVSGTGLDQVLARRLQEGDLGGDVRRALAHFPFPQMAQRILGTLFIPGGKQPEEAYKAGEKPALKNSHWFDELCIVSNFVEVFLAREGHSNPVGINYLEKIQFPHLPSAYGAMLAGAAVVIVGAGIPVEFPGVLDALSRHEAATYTIRVHGATPETDCQRVFDPALFIEDGCTPPPLLRPDFLPIISSDSLATMLLRRASGSVEGFVIEGPTAGGHNAPPRGPLQLTSDGQPIYGARDVVKLEAMRKIGMPFWLGGAYGSPEALRAALAEGAAGVQVGTPFALCEESGLTPETRRALIRQALAGNGKVFTDPLASPTGFPFKVAQLEGTLPIRPSMRPAAGSAIWAICLRPTARKTARSATAVPLNLWPHMSPRAARRRTPWGASASATGFLAISASRRCGPTVPASRRLSRWATTWPTSGVSVRWTRWTTPPPMPSV